MKLVFSKGCYCVFTARRKGNFIVMNLKKPFENGHTHITGYKPARMVAVWAYHKNFPRDCSPYLLVSLLRLTDDSEYASRVKQALAQKKSDKK